MNRITEAHIFVWRATPAIQCALRLFINLFFYRFIVIFNMKYHFLKIFHKKSIIFDAIIGARMNIKLGSGFYFIEDRYQDNDRCRVVNPRWPTLIDRTLFSASVNKKRQ